MTQFKDLAFMVTDMEIVEKKQMLFFNESGALAKCTNCIVHGQNLARTKMQRNYVHVYTLIIIRLFIMLEGATVRATIPSQGCGKLPLSKSARL